MRVLGLDAGTATLRFQLLEAGRRRARGMVDRIGARSVLEFRGEAGERLRRSGPVADAEAAALLALEWLRVVGCAPDVVALRARGTGDGAAPLDATGVEALLRSGDDPPARGALRAALAAGGGAALVAVQENGPHALAHREQAAHGAPLLGRPEAGLVTLHVGARASIAAPGGGVPEALEAPGADLRELFRAERAGDREAAAALGAFLGRLRRALGAALQAIEVDGVVLGGGAAEGSPVLRERLAEGLLPLEHDLNARPIARDVSLSSPGARPAVLVVRADVATLAAVEAARLFPPE